MRAEEAQAAPGKDPGPPGIVRRNTSDQGLAENYFASAWDQFHAIADRPGLIAVRHIELANRTIQIRVSKGAMERAIMPGLAHLLCADVAEPDLVLCAWDSEETAAPLLTPEWSIEDYRKEGLVSGLNDDRFHTAAQFYPTIFRMLDMERKRALYWTPSARILSYGERGAPLRLLLHEWLRRIGMVGVHGGAVGRADGGVFLAGIGGQGKSNIALACLNSELFYAADDFCFVSKSPHWKVHSLYCTGRLSPSDLIRHPYLRSCERCADGAADEKLLFFLNGTFGDKLIREMPLRAVVLPRVVGQGPSKIVASDPVPAQAAIALSTMMMSRWSGRNTGTKIGELLRELPCYEVQVGGSVEEVPRLLADLLDELNPAS